MALLMLADLAYVTFVMHGAPDRMNQTCSQITVGMTPDELTQFSVANDLYYPPQQTGRSYLADRRSFGRLGCLVEWDSAKVKSASVNFAD